MKPITKIGLYIAILMFIGIPRTLADFQEKLYCQINKEKIVISLDNKRSYRCNVYIRYIETQMKKVYIDILAIQKYIDKKEDLGYRQPLKNDKVAFLNLLQTMRLNILAHMETFEINLIEASRKHFLNSIGDYQKDLNRSLKKLRDLNNPNAEKYIKLIEQQLDTIVAISKEKTFDGLNKNIERYVYLKKQIWR
jgi:hypothetical protein